MQTEPDESELEEEGTPGPVCLAPARDAEEDPDGEFESSCGEPAVTEREIEGIMFPLCAEHAQELDAESEGPVGV